MAYRQRYDPRTRRDPRGRRDRYEEYEEERPTSRYSRFRVPRNSGLKAAVMILSVLLLVVSMLGLAGWKSRSDKIKEYNAKVRELKEFLADRADREDTARHEDDKRRAGPGGLYLARSEPDYIESKGPRFYYDRYKQMERELYGVRREANMYKAKLTAEQLASIQFSWDLVGTHVVINPMADPKNPAGEQLQITFRAENRSAKNMRNIRGTFRFWNKREIVLEQVFKIDHIAAGKHKSVVLIVPLVNYELYNCNMYPGRDY